MQSLYSKTLPISTATLTELGLPQSRVFNRHPNKVPTKIMCVCVYVCQLICAMVVPSVYQL